MYEFVNVPVPSHLVTEVMRFVADHASPTHPETPGGPVVADDVPQLDLDESSESRDWTRAELELLHSSTAPSVQLFARMLTLLAGITPESMSVEQIGDALGIEGSRMQSTFGPVSTWMKNRMGGSVQWPLVFPGHRLWAMNEHNATLWKEVTK